MDWQQRLNHALDYIENHLEQKLDMETLAQQAFCSTFHFLRMFEVITGVTAGEYVRRRRLSQAALTIAQGQKVIDTALQYGYESPEAFAKAFKRLFGFTPSDASQPGARLVTFPPIQVSVSLKGMEQMHYRIEEKPAFTATGIALRVSKVHQEQLQRIPKFWEENHRNGLIATLCQHCGPLGLLGICCEWDNAAEEFTYLIAIEQPNYPVKLPSHLRRITLPTATYGIFESRGAMPDAIQQTWQRVYREWFPQSGYEHANAPDFEVYPCFPENDPRGQLDSPECYNEVWIPLKKSR